MHRFGLERHVAVGIEISVEVAAGLDPVEHLDAADLDHPVAAGRIEPGGFGVEDDFPHASNLSARRRVRDKRLFRATWLSVVDRSPPVSTTKSARARFSASGIWRARIESSFAAVMPGRASTRSRWTSAGAETTMTLSNASSPSVSNSKGNVEQERRRVGDGRR